MGVPPQGHPLHPQHPGNMNPQSMQQGQSMQPQGIPPQFQANMPPNAGHGGLPIAAPQRMPIHTMPPPHMMPGRMPVHMVPGGAPAMPRFMGPPQTQPMPPQQPPMQMQQGPR